MSSEKRHFTSSRLRARVRLARVSAVVAVLAGVLVAPAAALRITDETRSVPSGAVGVSYAHQFRGVGSCGPDLLAGSQGLPYSWKVRNGALPPGLVLTPDGLLTGTPTHAGDYGFWIELADENPPRASWCVPHQSEEEFSMRVESGFVILNDPQLHATVGSPVTHTLDVMLASSLGPPTGSRPTGVTWSVVGGELPAGLSVTNGVITGNPARAGDWKFDVRAALGGERATVTTMTMAVRAPVNVVTAHVLKSEVGIRFKRALAARGGEVAKSYTWSLAGGVLPRGLRMGADGLITGTPKTVGTFRFSASATDDRGRKGDYAGSLSVASRLSLSTKRLQPARVGRPFKLELQTKGGVSPAKWRIRGGKLPRGMTLTRLGVLTGTPKKAGRYRISVEVKDALRVKTSKTFRLVVLK